MAHQRDEADKRLSDFLDKAAEDKAAREEEARRRVERPKQFGLTFAAVISQKVRPILEDACQPWIERGLSAGVRDDHSSWNPSVKLTVQPNPGLTASLIYEGQVEERKVSVYGYFGPGAGDAFGQFGLNDITREMVRSHVNKFQAEVIRLADA